MRSFLQPFGLLLALTPVFLMVGFLSAGAGHGHYLFAKVLFPFTMLSTVFLDSITLPFLLLALVQFPVYGFIMGLANVRGHLRESTIAISIAHLFAVIACFAFIGENFS